MKVVYVHGAGRQENRHLLKRRLDGHLFGSDQLERTVLAYYSDVLHVEAALPDELEAPPDPEAAAIARVLETRAMEVAAAQPMALADEGATLPVRSLVREALGAATESPDAASGAPEAAAWPEAPSLGR